jgi:SagB-type dehydrogenase family enzyme
MIRKTAKFDTIGAEFVQNSTYAHMAPSPESIGADPPVYLPSIADESQLIPLPEPQSIPLGYADLRKVVEQRRSVRRYDENAQLTLEELSYLLWMTQGIVHLSEKTGRTLRTVPSAGARHPFETYLALRRVENLEPGIYHFISQHHSLERFIQGEQILNALGEAAGRQNHVFTCAATFIWVAIPYRTSYRYGTRAYRYIFLDAGHICQNLHLAAEAIDFGVCAIGAYNDELVNVLLKLDGQEQFVAYMATLGKKL